MLDSLLEIAFACNVLKEEKDDVKNKERDPVDVHYEKLNAVITVGCPFYKVSG